MKQTAHGKKMPVTQTGKAAIRDLTLLFSVPLGVLLLAAGIIYGPQLIANPHDDFLYIACSGYRDDCADAYRVSADGKLETAPVATRDVLSSALYDKYAGSDIGSLYYYDTSEQTSTRMTLSEAQAYTYSKSDTSPDGYRLQQYSNSGGFLFWGTSGEGWQLEKGLMKKRVTLAGNEYDTKQLIGWIAQ